MSDPTPCLVSDWRTDPYTWRWRHSPRVTLWQGRTLPPKLTYALAESDGASYLDVQPFWVSSETLLCFWLGAAGAEESDEA